MTDKQFTIDQLRKDKIIYATEATALNVFCLLTFLGSEYIEGTLFPFLAGYVRPLSVLIALGYSLFMGIGNFIRLKKIRSLESKS
jgi:hypothetical protein